jgi:hypothetical protein
LVTEDDAAPVAGGVEEDLVDVLHELPTDVESGD